jgi:DNA-binding transcriptional MocR family regulator
MTVPAAKFVLPPLSAAGPGTLYQQIIDGLKREVSEGRLPGGSPLPSFRGPAAELMVSVITVKTRLRGTRARRDHLPPAGTRNVRREGGGGSEP